MSNQNTNDLNVNRANEVNANNINNINNTTIRILLDFYMNLHTQTVRRIDSLYDILDEIRSAINVLGGIDARINETNRNRNRNHDDFRYTNGRYFDGEQGNRGGGGGRTNGRGANWRGANGRSGRGGAQTDERRHSWNNQNNAQTQPYFDWLNNRVYIEGTPYRLEFERYTVPPTTRSNSNSNSNINDNEMLNFIQNFYSNVQVTATPAQIQTATRLTRFSTIINPINSNCPITLEPFAVDANVTEIIGCSHLFNPEALSSWFQSNVRCPVCRYDIRTNRVAPRQESTEETKEEGELEETKEDSLPVPQFPQSPEGPVERNNINPRRMRPRQQTDASGSVLESALSEITGSLLNQLFNTTSQNGSANRVFFNNTFDASNNEIIFRGFRM